MSTIFLLENGTGVTNATSYSSVDQADIAAEGKQKGASWLLLTDEQKQLALMLSTTYLDNRFRWYGQSLLQTQGLQWPRTKNIDNRGFIIPSGTIPQQLLDACITLAMEAGEDTEVLEAFFGGSSVKSVEMINSLRVDFDTSSDKLAAFLGNRYPGLEMNLSSIGTFIDSDELSDNVTTVQQ